MLDIKVEHSKWGDIKLVCPCSKNNDVKKAFDLELINGQVMFYCTNKDCNNFFPSEIQLKILSDIEKWIEKHGTIEGFNNTFYKTILIPKKTQLKLACYTKEKCKMHAKYLRTEKVGKTEPVYYHVIEIANETLMNNSQLLEYQYIPKEGEDGTK